MTQQPKSKEEILSIADKSNPYTIPAFRSGFNEGFIKGWEAYAEQQRGCGRWRDGTHLPQTNGTKICRLKKAGMVTVVEFSVLTEWDTSYPYDKFEWLDESNVCECQQLREAAKELLHLHSCEQEGLQSGKPTPEMWFNAVNKLSEALSDAGNKEETK